MERSFNVADETFKACLGARALLNQGHWSDEQKIRATSGGVKFNLSILKRTVWRAGGWYFVAFVLLCTAGVRAACPVSFSPRSRSHGYVLASNYVDFSTDCRWRVINTNSWITFTSATNGVAGRSRLQYTVALNTDSRPRSGNIRIGNGYFLITQAGGHPVIVTPPVDQSVAAGGTAKFSATIDGTPPFACQWQRNGVPLTNGNGISGATTPNLVLSSVQTSQAGKYRVLVTSPGFKKYSPRATLTVSCGFTLSASQAGFGSLGATGSVALNTFSANCRWSTVNTNPWITILSSIANSGSGVVVYALAANPAPTPRGGNLRIADQTLAITQAGSASTNAEIALAEALDTEGELQWSTIGTPAWFGQSLVAHDGADAAQSGTISDGTAVSAQTEITGPGTLSFWWKVSSETNKDYLKFFVEGAQQTRISGEADWRLLSYTFPSGVYALKWTYSKSPTGTAGQDRGWLDQVQFLPGAGCGGTLSHLGATHSSAGETGQVNVTVADGCDWNVISLSSWITPVVEAGGSNGLVRYTLATNSLPASRTGVIVIAGQPFTLVQQGAPIPCAFLISPGGQTHDAGEATGIVTVTTQAGCPWSVFNSNAWITILSIVTNSSGGQVTYSLSPNATSVTRSGNILLADRTFAVVQLGEPDLPQAPVIVTQPVPYRSENAGSSVQWNVAASGTGPLSYQWLFQNTPMAGANSNSLALNNVQTVNVGRYQVIVSNAYGAVTSAVAVLNIPDHLPGAGTISFLNFSFNRVLDADGTNFVAVGGTLVVGLFAGPAPDNLQLQAPVIGFTPVPGRFLGGTRTISNTVPNQLVWMQVKVWDSAFGDSYEEATAAGGKRGDSGLFQTRLGGSVIPPGTLDNMPGFALSLPKTLARRVAAAPASPATPLVLHRLVPSTNGWKLTLTGPVSATCMIETSTDLVTWKTVATVVNKSGVVEYTHGDHSEARRFYRVRLVNP